MHDKNQRMTSFNSVQKMPDDDDDEVWTIKYTYLIDHYFIPI